MAVLSKWGGGAGICLAAIYIFGFTLFLGVIDRSGYSGPEGQLAMVVDQVGILTLAFAVLYVLAACALTILVVAMHQGAVAGQAQYKPTAGVHIAAAFGLIWAGLLFASGFIGITGMQAVITLASEHPQIAQSSWTAIAIIQNALGGGIELVGGVWMAMVSWLAMRAQHMSKPLGWLGVVIGAVGCVTVVPQAADLVDIFGIGQIVWFAWLGITLLQTASPGIRAEHSG